MIPGSWEHNDLVALKGRFLTTFLQGGFHEDLITILLGVYYIYVCVCVYVSMYVCMYACMYVYVYVYVNVYVYVYVYVYVNVYVYVYVYVYGIAALARSTRNAEC